MKELKSLQRLVSDLAELAQLEALVAILLDEIIQALSKGLKDETRVLDLIRRSVDEIILKLDDVVLAATLVFDIGQDV